MTGGLRLLLEDFLGLMREEGELDVFLPLLMSAMGHEVVYRAQKGPRQFGVDIVSVGPGSRGKRQLFLWLVKCGDIGRSEWSLGLQSVRQSIEDIGDTYLRSHLAPEHKRLGRKLLIVTNGDFSSNLNQTIAGYLESWCRAKRVDAEQVNGSRLAAWAEQYLLDEYILPKDNRALLRRTLANVSSPDLCIRVGRRLIDEMLSAATAPRKSRGAETKGLLTSLRGIRTALLVLHVWSVNEDNIRAVCSLSQYAVLAAWARLHPRLIDSDRKLSHEFAALLVGLATVKEAYHHRMEPFYVTQDALASVLPHPLLVSRAAFDALGDIGQQGCFFAFQAVVTGSMTMQAAALRHVARISSLLKSHSCCDLPAFDYQSANIHVALLLLMAAGQRSIATNWVDRITQRLGAATSAKRFLPTTAAFEEALELQDANDDAQDEFRRTSTLVPILLIWTAALGLTEAYAFLRTEVMPRMKAATPNMWTPEPGFDGVLADGVEVHEHGIAEAITQVPEDPTEFLETMRQPLPGVEGIESSTWYRLRASEIPLLAALHWQSQLPRQMLVEQALAFAAHVIPEQADAPVN